MNRILVSTLTFFLFINCAISTHAQSGIAEYSIQTQSPVQFSMVGFSIAIHSEFNNPYDANEILLDMVVLTPTGKRIVVPCFYVSGSSPTSSWEARFTPREVGVYSYTFELKRLGLLASTSSTGEFSVEASDGKGFLSPSSNWTFRFDNGEHFRGVGLNIGWEGRTWDNPASIFTYEHYLSKLSASGANFIRTWMCQWNLPLEWQTVSQTNRYNHRTAYFHPQAIRRMDQFVELSMANGIYVMLCLEVHGSIVGDEWNDSPYNSANGGPCTNRADFFSNEAAKAKFKNRLRYLVARWGYSPNIAMWELFNEIDNVSRPLGIPHAIITQWHKEMSSYLKQIDPYGRMVTTSISHDYITGLFDIETIDINQMHIYWDAKDMINRIQNGTSAHGKPFVIGESGWTWDWNVDFNIPANRENLIFDFKRGLWYGAFTATPIYPMSWWWEFFDQQNMFYYFKAVSHITQRMIEEGKGEFQKVNASGAGVDAYGVKCGNTLFVYALNLTHSSVTTNLNVASAHPNSQYQIWMLNPETNLYTNLGSTVASSNGMVSIPSVALPGRHGNIFVISIPGAGGTDTISPTSPSNLRVAISGPESIVIDWDSSTDNLGTHGYEVLLNQHPIEIRNGLRTTISGLDTLTTYGIAVVAIDKAGNRSVASLPIEASTTDGPLIVQAQAYTGMAGILVESSTDAGGGFNVGRIDPNDWMLYTDVDIPHSGFYAVEFRIASQGGGGRLAFECGQTGTAYGSVTIPATGGWQRWESISSNFNITAGQRAFRIKAQTGGWNINWFSFTPLAYTSAVPDVHKSEAGFALASISIAPNPITVESATIYVNLQKQQRVVLSLLNAQGREVKRIADTMLPSGEHTFNLSGELPKGLYLLRLSSPETNITTKIIVS